MDEAQGSEGGQRPQGEGVGERIGGSLGRLARGARAASRSAQPEAERLARQARAAAEAALPHIQRASTEAASRTTRFVREHEGEIRQVAGTAGRLVVFRVGPPVLRPVMFSALDGLVRRPGEKPAEQPEAKEQSGDRDRPGPPHIF